MKYAVVSLGKHGNTRQFYLLLVSSNVFDHYSVKSLGFQPRPVFEYLLKTKPFHKTCGPEYLFVCV